MTSGEDKAPLARPTSPPGSEITTNGELFAYSHGCSSPTRGRDPAHHAAPSSGSGAPSHWFLAETLWMGIPSPFASAQQSAASSSTSAAPGPPPQLPPSAASHGAESAGKKDHRAALRPAATDARRSSYVSRWMGVSPSPFDTSHPPAFSIAGPSASSCSRGTEVDVKRRKVTHQAELSGEARGSGSPRSSKPEEPEEEHEQKLPPPVKEEHEKQLPPPVNKEHKHQLPPPVKKEHKHQLPPPVKEEHEQQLPPPEPEVSNPWGQKRLRMSRDRLCTHLPPGVPRKISYDSNIRDAAAEVQRRLGTHLDLSHLSATEQLAAVLPGHHNPNPRWRRLLMDSFSDFCDAHLMPHPPPPPPPI